MAGAGIRLDILIIKPSSFGDIIHGLQAAQSIRRQLPGCRISWVVREIFYPLVRSCEAVDECFIFNRHRWLTGFGKLLWEVRREPFDVVLDMQGLARSGLIALAARADRKIGRFDARELSALACRERIELPAGGKGSHAVEILFQFLPAIGCEPMIHGPLEFRHPVIRCFDPELLEGGPLVIFPDSRRPEKQWPYFDGLVVALLEEFPDTPIVLAGSSEISGNFAPSRDGRLRNLIGLTAIDELIPVVSKARLVIANDSGPMHLAAAIGTPVLALFGPTDPERYGPFPLIKVTNQVLSAPDGDLAKLEIETVLDEIESILNP